MKRCCPNSPHGGSHPGTLTAILILDFSDEIPLRQERSEKSYAPPLLGVREEPAAELAEEEPAYENKEESRGDGGILFGHPARRRQKHIGEALRRELQSHLAPTVEATWSRACDGNVAIILRGDTRDCRLDPVIEAIGEFLRKRNASDRVIVSMALRAAPAL